MIEESNSSVFFFSSRRRHTRWTGDWSSDVCSSDLGAQQVVESSIGLLRASEARVLPHRPESRPVPVRADAPRVRVLAGWRRAVRLIDVEGFERDARLGLGEDAGFCAGGVAHGCDPVFSWSGWHSSVSTPPAAEGWRN